MSLAIVEAQKSRPASGCVGVLFLHLLDWNRTIAKKNKKSKKNKKKKKHEQFSMRTVLPPLLKRTSNKASPLSSPLHKSMSLEKKREDDLLKESDGNNTMGQPSLVARLMGQPSLVARLMGLDSMPVSSLQNPKNPQKLKDCVKDSNYNYNARPQKVQKTSSGSGSFGSNPTRIKRNEEKQKILCFSSRSPSRSPRARLAQAAAKILEPGLRPRFSTSPLRYLHNVERQEEEIRVCGLVETEFGGFGCEKSETETEEPLVLRDGLNVERETVVINNMEMKISNIDSYCLERKSKKLENSREILKTHSLKNKRSLVEKRPNHRSAIKQSIVTKSSPFTPVAKDRTVLNRAKISRSNLENPNKCAHMEPSKKFQQFKTEKRKDRTEFIMSNHHNNSVKDRTSKNRACSEKIGKKSNAIRVEKSRRFAEQKGLGFSEKEITGDDLSRRLTCSILEKLRSEINEEEGNIYQKTCFKGEIDQPSPISILESSFSNDSFSFDSANNYSECKLFLDSTETSNQAKKFDLSFLSSRLNFTGEISSNFELLFSNIISSDFNSKMEYSVNKFLLELLESVMDASSFDLTGQKEGYQLTNFTVDCIVEILDSKSRFLCKSGFEIWDLLSRFLSKDCLVKEICEEVQRWNEMEGKSLDFIAERDLRNSDFNWRKFEFEGFGIGEEIERDLIGEFVDEFVLELCY